MTREKHPVRTGCVGICRPPGAEISYLGELGVLSEAGERNPESEPVDGEVRSKTRDPHRVVRLSERSIQPSKRCCILQHYDVLLQ